MTGLDIYKCYTLFDISHKRNLDTLLQIISLRAQPLMIAEPKIIQADLRYYSFGSRYTGLAKIWTLEFGIEQREVYGLRDNPVAKLMDDSVMVPMSVGLDESVDIDPACIITNDELRNTYFMLDPL